MVRELESVFRSELVLQLGSVSAWAWQSASAWVMGLESELGLDSR